MTLSTPASAGLLRLARVFTVAAAVALTGCASYYVDGNTKEVTAAQFRRPAAPKPVQMVFEFQTKGAPNTRATDLLKAQVAEIVQTSGLFSQVSDAPVQGGGLISVTLNNVPLSDDAFRKGFVTGLTFGLAGSTVSDGYVCTVKYLDSSSQPAITKATRHAIHTSMGTGGAPAGAMKADSIDAAVRLMTRQVVSSALNELSSDAAFK
jgi:hypothetical protein